MRLVRIPKGFACLCSYENRGIPKDAGFQWDGNAKHWWTPSATTAAALVDFADEVLGAELRKQKDEAGAAAELSEAAASDFDPPAPEGFRFYPFQKAGVLYGLKKMQQEGGAPKHGVLIADEPGLGKSCQSIGILNCLPDVRKVLIICPASLKINWTREWRRVRIGPTAEDFGIASGKGFLPNTPVVIINFDILKYHLDEIKSRAFDACIMDECHYIKGSSQRTKAAMAIKTRYRIALSGTPILNRPIEIFNVLKWLRPDIWSNKFFFAQDYCGLQKTRFGMDMSGATNLDRLNVQLKQNVMVRRRKADVLPDLPPKIHQVLELPADDCQEVIQAEWMAHQHVEATIQKLKVAHQLAKASASDEDYKEAVKKLKEGVAAAWSEMTLERKRVALAKIPYMVAHLKDVLEEGAPVIAFAHHHEVIDKICGSFVGKNVKLTGRSSLSERQNAVDLFQSGRVPLFVGNLQAAGVGITLTASSHVVHCEQDWTPAIMDQGSDRSHRIGQTRGVLIQYLVLEGSLDAYMAKKRVEKQEVIDAVLNNEVAAELMHEADSKGECSTSDITRKQVVSKAGSLGPEQVGFIHAALQLLLESALNEMDLEICRELAQSVVLTPRQAALGIELLTANADLLPAEVVEELAKLA